MTKLTYQELQLPHYINTSVAARLPAKVNGKSRILELTLTDVVFAAELAGLNLMFLSDTGKGKTQLVKDIAWYHFGGDRETGNANWTQGRPDFEIEDLFVRSRVDLSTGVYDSKSVRQIDENRIGRLCNVVDELNRAPKPTQNKFFDFADGNYELAGTSHPIGKDGYCLCFTTLNLNKINGEFSGTFETDRALLNRAHVTVDLDHKDFCPTPGDKIKIRKKKRGPRIDRAEPRDISDKILTAHREIIASIETSDPYITAFEFLIDNGLNYCERDKYHEKGPDFPMKCTECDAPCKTEGLCNLIKGSSERTVNAIAPLAYALSYIATLKYGTEVHIDTLDAVLQAFKFTTYHGNLNEEFCTEQYAGRRQAMMDDIVTKFEDCSNLVRKYMPLTGNGHTGEMMIFIMDGVKTTCEKTPALEKELNRRNIPFTTSKLDHELKKRGIGTDWIDEFRREMSSR